MTRSATALPYQNPLHNFTDPTQPERLRFSAIDRTYSCFLPSSDHHIVTQDGRKWPTVEHFYHASKFHGGQFDDMISKEHSLEEVCVGKTTFHTFKRIDKLAFIQTYFSQTFDLIIVMFTTQFHTFKRTEILYIYIHISHS